MNKSLESYAREKLKLGLAELPETWCNTFKLMYGRNGGKRSVEDAKAMPINDVVDEMDSKQLDWAMTQIDNSFEKIEKQNNEN